MTDSSRISKKAYIHIGMHKTGTTSIQHFLQEQRDVLQAHGYGFYQGMVFPENHVELHAASMRPERESGYKNRANLRVDDKYINEVRERIESFVKASRASCIIFSNEGLSLLRYADELEMLKSLFPGMRFQIVVYLRNKKDYLRSYAAQINKIKGTLPAQINKDSFAYTSSDTWLLDYANRIKLFIDAFGEANVRVLDYDKVLGEEGNVIPSFLDWLALPTKFDPKDWKNCFLNRS